MGKIKNALYRFMYGRYGSDHLNVVILIFTFILLLMNQLVFKNGIVVIIVWALLILEIFRTYSRNIAKRRQENTKFLALIHPFKKWIRLIKKKTNDKDHKYYKCPNCKQDIRVPKGRGKIVITCPKCTNKFERKS